MNFEPNLYQGLYSLEDQVYRAGIFVSGYTSRILVPDIGYVIAVGLTRNFFHVDALGNVGESLLSSNPLVGDSFIFAGNTLEFRNRSVSVSPDILGTEWLILPTASQSPPYIDSDTVTLVPGQTYQVFNASNPDRANFGVNTTDPCSIDPSGGVDSGGVHFDIQCAPVLPPDSDGDGLADDIDNCPAVFNPEQIDQDADGSGDVCDLDRDGDGESNESDNCPDFPNPDQADTDGDGIGNLCDDDLDGDNVSDNLDNCPLVSNPGQEDSDHDGLGDACDSDIDGDGVTNGDDNCVQIPNFDQSDIDGDGFGDICDTDSDGDGIATEQDQCPATPLGSPVTSEGCSAAQYIDLICQKENFRNHGGYVSCVSQAANDLKAAGIISGKEKGRIVSQAAKNK